MPSKRPKRMVIIQPDGTETTTDFEGEPTLGDLQRGVDGYIEHIRVRYGGKIRDGYVNEEGLLKHLPRNPKAVTMAREFGYGERICGNLVIVIPVPEIERAET